MSEIKAVGFDMGGVLLPGTMGLGFKLMAQHLGVAQSAIETAIWAEREQLEVSAVTEHDYWQRVARSVGSHEMPEQLAQWWLEGYLERNPIQPQMMELVVRLKANGYKVGLLSNIDADDAKFNRERHLFDDFDVTLLSSELKLRKPDPLAYGALAGGLDVSYPELIFIDDQKGNIEAAQALGIHGLIFTTYTQLVHDLYTLNINIS